MREKIDNLFSLLDSALKRFMNQIQKRLFRMLLSLFLFIIALSFVLVGVVFLLSRIMPWDVALIVFGIALLAIAVNLIEFFCSAGLPAIFTKILSLNHLNSFGYYSYFQTINIYY